MVKTLKIDSNTIVDYFSREGGIIYRAERWMRNLGSLEGHVMIKEQITQFDHREFGFNYDDVEETGFKYTDDEPILFSRGDCSDTLYLDYEKIPGLIRYKGKIIGEFNLPYRVPEKPAWVPYGDDSQPKLISTNKSKRCEKEIFDLLKVIVALERSRNPQ